MWYENFIPFSLCPFLHGAGLGAFWSFEREAQGSIFAFPQSEHRITMNVLTVTRRRPLRRFRGKKATAGRYPIYRSSHRSARSPALQRYADLQNPGME